MRSVKLNAAIVGREPGIEQVVSRMADSRSLPVRSDIEKLNAVGIADEDEDWFFVV